MIQCITFDLDDTLWAVEPVISAANQTLFDWLAVHAPALPTHFGVDDLPTLRQQVLQQQPEIGYSVTRVRQQQLRLMLRHAGYTSDEVEHLAARAFDVFLHARQQVNFFADALQMLKTLQQQGYRLGALTNGNADIQRTGLSHLLSFQVSADQVGVEKPDVVIFQQMLHQQGLRPEQVIHVGDHPEHDIRGAHGAGLWSIWVNHNRCQAQPPADHQVHALVEIPAAVAQIADHAASRVTL